MNSPPGSTRGRSPPRRGSNVSLEDINVEGNSSPSQSVVSKARGLLDQLREKARRGSGPERAACEALARECESKLDEMEKRLSRENSPRAGNSRSGSPVSSRSPPRSPPANSFASAVKRKLEVGSNDGFSFFSSLRMAMQSIIQEASPYALICAVTAMLVRAYPSDVRLGPMVAVAVYSAVLSITTFVSGLAFNMVVSVSMANVSTAVSTTAWTVVGRRIWLAITTALICGAGCGVALMILQEPIFDLLLFSLAERTMATPYWFVRCATLPAILVLRVVSGVLAGFQRGTSLTLYSFISCLVEAILSFVVLFPLGWGLEGVGFVSLLVNIVFAVLGILALPFLQPNEARGRISLWADLPCLSCLCRKTVDNARNSRNQPLLYEMGEPPAPPFSPCAFLRDGSDTIIRYVCLQGSLLAVGICASRLGENMLTAHHMAVLMWMVTSYIIDGFSDVGTLTASRLLASRDYVQLKQLCSRLAFLGLVVGLVFGGLSWFFKDIIVSVLLGSANTIVLMRIDQLWPLICLMQLVNSIVFTYDGLMMASAQFAYVRNVLVVGAVFIFAPALFIGFNMYTSLLSVWLALAVLNVWRFITAIVRIHWCLWPRWREGSLMV